MRNVILIVCLLALVSAPLTTWAQIPTQDPLGLYPSVWGQAARNHGIDPYLLYAISIIESRQTYEDGLVRPSPFALHRNGRSSRSVYPQTISEARSTLATMLNETSNVDIGTMQINCRWHCNKVSNPSDLLDYKTNIHVAAQILSEAMASAPQDPILGAGRYHNWTDEDRARGYGFKAVRLAVALRKIETRRGA